MESLLDAVIAIGKATCVGDRDVPGVGSEVEEYVGCCVGDDDGRRAGVGDVPGL